MADLPGLYVIQLIVQDGLLGSAPVTAALRAEVVNQAPVITSQAPTEASAGEPYRYQVQAEDCDGDILSYALVQAPAGMDIAAHSGLISWTPGEEELGAHAVAIRVSDPRGASATQIYTVSLAEPPDAPPRITSYPPSEVYLGEEYSYRLVAQDPEGATLQFALHSGPDAMAVDPDSGLVRWLPTRGGDYPISLSACDPAGNRGQQSFTLRVRAEAIPADPAQSAPPLDNTPGAAFGEAVAFLYQGPAAVQSRLQPHALQSERIAVLRGQVRTRGGTPLAGVRISVKDAPELGYTASRSDGWFDLVVNGGGALVIGYSKSGFLPVQRTIRVPTEEYTVLPEVALTALDAQVTRIALGAGIGQTQIAHGSLSEDGDGQRRATVIIPPGTTASYLRADASQVVLEQMSLRATEYTVGADGPKAMPGPLPPASGYTYAVELSADEALSDGQKVAGKDVLFNQPVAVYVENFIGFPVGSVVPVGYYNSDAARWVPAENGRVIKVLRHDGGGERTLAQLDLDGSGVPASAEALAVAGIRAEERVRLAEIYAPGTELWRFATSHLSTWDLNWPYGPPVGAQPPAPLQCPGGGGPLVSGSAIRIGTGTISERIAVAGTDQSLVFNSARLAAVSLEHRLDASSAHPKLKRVEYGINIAGQVIEAGSITDPVPGQRIAFTWNGRDAYGRTLSGPVTARAFVSNVYQAVRYRPAEMTRVFGSFANLMADTASRAANAVSVASDRDNFEVAITRESSLRLAAVGATDPGTTLGNGALNLSDLPLLDTEHGLLIHASGNVSSGSAVLQSLIGAGRGAGPRLGEPVALARDPTGVLVVATSDGIYRLQSGAAQLLAGGDQFQDIRRIRYTPSGELLVLARLQADALGVRLFALSREGAVRVVAGSGEPGCGTEITQDGQTRFALPFWDPQTPFSASAVALRLSDASDIAVAASGDSYFNVGGSGDIYLADAGCHVLYRLRADSEDIYVVAGNGTDRVDTLAGPAGGLVRPALANPLSLALDWRGNLYIGTADGLIHRLGTDNWIETIAGSGEVGYGGDGGPASEARFGPIDELLISAEDMLYVDDTAANARLRRIAPCGRVQTIAGTGSAGFSADGLTAAGAPIGPIAGMLLDGKGRLYFGQGALEGTAPGVRRIASSYAKLPWQQEYRVPLQGAQAIGVFDAHGRLQRTLDAKSGTELQAVHYDDAGLLSGIVDEHGRASRIERDAAGRIGAILAPNGQRTAIGYDASGRPTTVTHPDGARWTLAYDAAGLLTHFTDPNANTTSFTYDSAGRLLTDTDAAGGGWRLEHDLDAHSHQVRYTTAEGRAHLYSAQSDPDTGMHTATTRGPNGGERITERDPVAHSSTTTLPNGTVIHTEALPSAVPGGTAPDTLRTITLPSGLRQTTETSSSWDLADAQNPASWVRAEQITEINGKAWRTHYHPATRTRTITSPEGRSTRTRFDALDRPLRTQTSGLAATEYSYDERGLLIATRQGEGEEQRITSYAYDALDHLQSTTDAEGHTTAYSTDAAGRVTQLTRADGEVIGFAYDAKGNLIGLTPPGRSEHAMQYSAVDLQTAYRPPAIAAQSGEVASTYNKDRDLIARSHALGAHISYGYDAAGRLQTRTTPQGESLYTYVANTDQVASITTPGGERLDYGYDGSLVSATQWSGTINASLATEWNQDFAIAAHTLNDLYRIDYHYDNDGLLTASGDLRLTHDADNGSLSTTGLGNITTAHTYNAFGESQSQRTSFDGNPLYQVTYVRDKRGRISEKTETIAGQTTTYSYGYDLADRLIAVKENGAVTGSWAYDGNGNRIEENAGRAGTYDEQDRLASYDLQARTRPVPTGEIEYLIDAQDRRIGKKRDGVLIQGFIYKDQLNPIAELDGDGNILSLFVYAEKENVPAYLIKIDPQSQAQTTYRIISDHLGSPRLVVDSQSGEIAQRMDYDVWGVVTRDSNPGFQPFGFAGGIYDRDTGLVRFGARDYDPYTGRWTAKDPIGFDGDGPNLYGYVLGDPVNGVDAQGKKKGVIDNVICALAPAMCFDPKKQQDRDIPCIEMDAQSCCACCSTRPISEALAVPPTVCCEKCLRKYGVTCLGFGSDNS